jgi:hypothetical protein
MSNSVKFFLGFAFSFALLVWLATCTAPEKPRSAAFSQPKPRGGAGPVGSNTRRVHAPEAPDP